MGSGFFLVLRGFEVMFSLIRWCGFPNTVYPSVRVVIGVKRANLSCAVPH